MTTTDLSLKEIYDLAKEVLETNGCDETSSSAVANTVCIAERDGSASHGLFRIPGYVKSLKSNKVNGKANPTINNLTQNAIRVDGDYGFAPVAINVGIPALTEITKKHGIGVLTITNTHHFAALWPETEALAEENLVGIACTAYMPMVAPSGTREKLFGTNPISFAWPRPGKSPVCYDMATAAMAMGDIQIAARDGETVPLGTGLDADGNETTDPAKIAAGVLLPFGGYKGSAIALMVELLAAGLTGEQFSYEAKANDNGDGGPPRGGEMIIGLSPALIAGDGWEDHVEAFMDRMSSIEGMRIPGARRHKNRLDTGPRNINEALVTTIRGLN